MQSFKRKSSPKLCLEATTVITEPTEPNNRKNRVLAAKKVYQRSKRIRVTKIPTPKESIREEVTVTPLENDDSDSESDFSTEVEILGKKKLIPPIPQTKMVKKLPEHFLDNQEIEAIPDQILQTKKVKQLPVPQIENHSSTDHLKHQFEAFAATQEKAFEEMSKRIELKFASLISTSTETNTNILTSQHEPFHPATRPAKSNGRLALQYQRLFYKNKHLEAKMEEIEFENQCNDFGFHF